MKKIFIFLLCIVIIIVALLYAKYVNYKAEQNKIKEQNLEYEYYLNRQILGTDVVTLINKAVHNNEQNNVKKDKDGFYIKNNFNSINIEIQITDNDTLYKMETLYNGGMVKFAEYYDSILFECEKVEYNDLRKISYMKFIQKTN